MTVKELMQTAEGREGLQYRPQKEKKRGKHLTSYKEIRKLSRDDVRFLCVFEGYYTNSNCEEFDEMLNRCGVVHELDIVEIALDIAAHSETACIKFIGDSCLSHKDFKLQIMHELASLTRSYFELV